MLVTKVTEECTVDTTYIIIVFVAIVTHTFVDRSKKEEWVREASKANEKEVDDLKIQLKQAVSKTEVCPLYINLQLVTEL